MYDPIQLSAQCTTRRTQLLAPIAPLDWGVPRYSGVIPQSSRAMDGRRGVYNPTWTLCMPPGALLRGLVGKVLEFGVVYQFAFSVKVLFPGCTGSNPSQVTF